MATETLYNEPVFPSSEDYPHPGLLIRDYFAAQALTALIAHGEGTLEKKVANAFRYADAMLAERARGEHA